MRNQGCDKTIRLTAGRGGLVGDSLYRPPGKARGKICEFALYDPTLPGS
jgi:hypothetical protein